MINLVKVRDKAEGQIKAHELLKKHVDGQTLLALSGGTTPNYKKMIIEPGDIVPGAICVVDERYGEPFHENSNERLLMEAGLKEFADKNCIETRKYLTGKGIVETEKTYDKVVADLFKRFPKKVGVVGVGKNLHTAGVFPNSPSCKSPDYVVSEKVDDKFPLRLTLTLKALGEFTVFIVLMFGDDKYEAFKKLMGKKEKDIQRYPAIFYRESKIPAYLITDIEL